MLKWKGPLCTKMYNFTIILSISSYHNNMAIYLLIHTFLEGVSFKLNKEEEITYQLF